MLRPPLIAFACLGLSIALCARGSAQDGSLDYPQWRGRTGDGSASGFVEPQLWPEALTRRWRVEVGEGYATPLIVGDTVYVITRRGGDEVVAALDAASGA